MRLSDAGPKILVDWVGKRGLDRFVVLVAVEVGVLLAIFGADWLLNNSHLYERLFYPVKGQVPSWDALSRTILILLGLPVALLLWFWRDRNVRDQIETARSETNLKQFQDIQLRISGAIDPQIATNARNTLEVAALYQLGDFLRGERGVSFAKPSFELVRARMDFYADNSGVNRIIRNLELSKRRLSRSAVPSHTYLSKNYSILLGLSHRARRRFFDWYGKYSQDFVGQSYRSFFREHLPFLVRAGFPVHLMKLFGISTGGADLSGVSLSGAKIYSCIFYDLVLTSTLLDNATLYGCRFARCRMENVNFLGARLDGAVFESSNLYGADFTECSLIAADFEECRLLAVRFVGANLSFVDLSGDDLRNVDFRRAVLINCNLDGAQLYQANLAGCDLRGARLTRIDPRDLASCKGAIFDDHTVFCLPTQETVLSWTSESMEELRALWRSAGARHVDEEPQSLIAPTD